MPSKTCPDTSPLLPSPGRCFMAAARSVPLRDVFASRGACFHRRHRLPQVSRHGQSRQHVVHVLRAQTWSSQWVRYIEPRRPRHFVGGEMRAPLQHVQAESVFPDTEALRSVRAQLTLSFGETPCTFKDQRRCRPDLTPRRRSTACGTLCASARSAARRYTAESRKVDFLPRSIWAAARRHGGVRQWKSGSRIQTAIALTRSAALRT
jgi:hypothetical protein